MLAFVRIRGGHNYLAHVVSYSSVSYGCRVLLDPNLI